MTNEKLPKCNVKLRPETWQVSRQLSILSYPCAKSRKPSECISSKTSPSGRLLQRACFDSLADLYTRLRNYLKLYNYVKLYSHRIQFRAIGSKMETLSLEDGQRTNQIYIFMSR